MTNRRMWQQVLTDIKLRQHLDAYIAILIGLVLAVLAVFGVVRFDVLAAAILATTSFVVWTTIDNRHALTQMGQKIEQGQESGSVLKFADFPEASIRSNLRGAAEVSLSGLNFSRFVQLYFDDIEYALRSGARLRIIVAEPSEAVIKMASFRSEVESSPEIERQRIVTTIEFLKHQCKRLKGCKVEVRSYPYLAPYSLTIIRPTDSHNQPYYHGRILPFRTPSLKAPVILPKSSDRAWVEFIESQFESLWLASSEIDIFSSGA